MSDVVIRGIDNARNAMFLEGFAQPGVIRVQERRQHARPHVAGIKVQPHGHGEKPLGGRPAVRSGVVLRVVQVIDHVYVSWRKRRGKRARNRGYFLVRPPVPSDPVRFRKPGHFEEPRVGVLPRFAQPQRRIVFSAKIQQVVDGAHVRRVPVLVEGVNDIVVPQIFQLRGERGGVVIPFYEEDMVLVDLADGLDESHVQGAQGFRLRHAVADGVGRYGFVDQVVPDDERFVCVAAGDFGPYGYQLVLVRVGFRPQAGCAVAVADGAGVLSAGRGVHVQNDVDFVFAAPFDERVDQFEPAFDERFRIGVEEQIVMHGEAEMVESPVGDGRNILFVDIVGPV